MESFYNYKNGGSGGGRCTRFKNINNDDDRLSSLPDAILSDILSHLNIKSAAAATSILSRRWRQLWTGLTRLSFFLESSTIVDCVLGQLTSPKLIAFRMKTRTTRITYNWESIFAHLCHRNVEEIEVCVPDVFHIPPPLHVPVSLFYCQSLVKLELFCINFDCKFSANDVVNLPKLKTLGLRLQDEGRELMKTLFRSCPALEDLYLLFDLDEDDHLVDIVAPNLKTLFIEIMSEKEPSLHKVMINAPKLENLTILGSFSFHCFIENPTMLVKASIGPWFGLDGNNIYMHIEECFSHISKFITGLSSVRHLMLSGNIILFPYLHSVGNWVMPKFHNLVYLETNLHKLSDWKNLLLSLQSFPNLKHLDVSRYGCESLEQMEWCAPDFVPDCLLSKLKIIKIKGVLGIHKEVKLLEFILKNAIVLEELLIGWNEVFCGEEGSQLWNEYKFCESLFKLSMSSSTCKVLFKGVFINASRNDFKNGLLSRQVRYHE